MRVLLCRLQEFLINTRRNIVSQELSQQYTGSVDNQAPMVFCVGNAMYRDNRYLVSEVSRQFLQLSGIPTLRQYCISIVSENQHRIATRFMRHDVPRLLNDIDLWLQSGTDTFDAERRANATRTMNGLEERLISVRSSLLHLLTGMTKAKLTELAWQHIVSAHGVSSAP